MNKWMKMTAVSAIAAAIMLPGAVSAQSMGNMKDSAASSMDVMMKDGHKLVPLRETAQRLGYMVDWTKAWTKLTKKMMGSMTDDSMTGMSESTDMKDMTDMTDMTDTKDMTGMKDMTDMKDTTDMKDMTDTKDMTDMKDMASMTYMVTIMPGSKDVWVGQMKKMITYAPVLIKGKMYVTQEFVDMFLTGMDGKDSGSGM